MFRIFNSCTFCLIVVMILGCFNHIVNGDCILFLKDQKPLLMQNFGSRKMILSKTHDQIDLKQDETIQAACARGSSLFTEYDDWYRLEPPIHLVEFQCVQGNLLYKRLENGSLVYMRSHSAQLGCVNETKILYESTQSLPNCERFMTYGIGSVGDGVGKRHHAQSMSVAMCYDLDSLSLKYVTYLGYRPMFNTSGQELTLRAFSNFNFKAIKEDTKLFLQFLSQKTFSETYARKKRIHPLLAIHEFDFMNIIQDESLRGELYAYEEMFNIIWWRNLRLGNWRLLLKALQARSEVVNYKIYTGVEGSMLMPPIDDCEKHRSFSFAAEEITVAAPAYIWTYIEALDNHTTERKYVFIGHNSPYYVEGEQVAFCNDICQNITWIRQSLLNVTHLMPTFGILHCCYAKDVAGKIASLPLKAEDIMGTATAFNTTTIKVDVTLNRTLRPTKKKVPTPPPTTTSTTAITIAHDLPFPGLDAKSDQSIEGKNSKPTYGQQFDDDYWMV